MTTEFERLLKGYSEYITKEDFRIVARISKQTARYLSLSGLASYINSGKKTRCYLIHHKAVLSYLLDREENLETYRPCHAVSNLSWAVLPYPENLSNCFHGIGKRDSFYSVFVAV